MYIKFINVLLILLVLFLIIFKNKKELFTSNNPLKFIHITKTGGTSVENVGNKKNIKWGRFDPMYQKYKFRKISPWHTPFDEYPIQIKKKYNWFMIVRNPYDRILSEYNCNWAGKHRLNVENTKEKFNEIVINEINKYHLGGHYIPQYKYFDKNQNIEIIKFENLTTEFNNLMQKYNLNIKLDVHNNKSKETFRVDDFSNELIELINDVYHKDFLLFGYKKKYIENFKHKKVAFCFLIRDKIHNEDVWEHFFKNIPKNKYNIYIHHKNNVKLKYFDKYKLNNNIETKWCDKSLVYAQNLLLEEALKDSDNQHFIFLSGNCVPIKNFNKIYNNLDQNYSYFKEPKKNNQIYKTSQWCILNRKHTKLILDNSNSFIEKNKPKNMCQDEYVYINILLNLNLKNEIIYKKSTWTSWHNKIDIDLKNSLINKKQPIDFKTINTFTLKQIIDSESFFARKFNDSCNLDLIKKIF